MAASASSTVVVVMAMAMAMMCGCAYGYDYYVAGRDGWVVNPSESFNHWAERNRFQVNDSLVFKYNKGEDSVLQVTMQDYESCNTSNPIKKMDDGESVFQLDRPGHFFFISGAPGRCARGEKLVVAVISPRKAHPPWSSLSPSPSASPTLPPSMSASAPWGSASVPVPSPVPGADTGDAEASCEVSVARVLLGLLVLCGACFI